MKFRLKSLGILFVFITLLAGATTFANNESSSSQGSGTNGNSPTSDEQSSCADFLKNIEVRLMTSAEAHRERLAALYKRHSEQAQEIEFKFGFESEYTLNNYASKLLNYYGPNLSMGLNEEAWFGLQPKDKKESDQRVEWIKKHLDQLFGSKKSLGNVVLLRPESAPRYLPKELILDYTGNLEIILQPADSFKEWQDRVGWIITNLGAGSMQSTIGIPKEMLFNVSDKKAALHTNVGYFQFMADLDSLLKLMQGYEKSLQEPTKPAASAFQHPFLGPLTNLKREYMNRIFTDNLNGKWDKETLKAIGFNDDSFKYIGSTSYRPDLGGKDYVVLEVRDAHSSYDVLHEKLTRAMYYFSRSREKFAPFFGVKAFDSVQDFDALPPEVRSLLIRVFPLKTLEPGEDYNEAEVIANQVYRNFAYPMRDWSLYLQAMGQEKSISKVIAAQKRYLETLINIEIRLASQEIDITAASLLVQAAIAKFSVDSGVLNLMLEWLEKTTAEMETISFHFDAFVHRLSA